MFHREMYNCDITVSNQSHIVPKHGNLYCERYTTLKIRTNRKYLMELVLFLTYIRVDAI